MYEKKSIKRILRKVKKNQISMNAAIDEFKTLPFEDLGFAKIDRHRVLRCGFPEVVFGAGKTEKQIVEIAVRMAEKTSVLLLTHVSEPIYRSIKKEIRDLKYDASARLAFLSPKKTRNKGLIVVVTAGTSDENVAKEAAVTARVMGNRVKLLLDVGVAGIHRLLKHIRLLQKANVLVVIAGMEGALASVVSGLVSKPVIAVPTSVGYGASFNGIAPLLTMLNSCSPGVTVVNIDNGFGAGYFASMINK